MGEDFKPGDVVVCVDDSSARHTGGPVPFRRGDLLRVAKAKLHPVSYVFSLGFVGLEWPGKPGLHAAYHADRFRKLPKADEEFTASIRACKPFRNRVPA